MQHEKRQKSIMRSPKQYAGNQWRLYAVDDTKLTSPSLADFCSLYNSVREAFEKAPSHQERCKILTHLDDEMGSSVQSPKKEEVVHVLINSKGVAKAKSFMTTSVRESYAQFRSAHPSIQIGRCEGRYIHQRTSKMQSTVRQIWTRPGCAAKCYMEGEVVLEAEFCYTLTSLKIGALIYRSKCKAITSIRKAAHLHVCGDNTLNSNKVCIHQWWPLPR